MNLSKTGERSHTLDKAAHLAGTAPSVVHPIGLWQTFKAKASILLPLVSILALAAGIFLGTISATLSNAVNRTVSILIDGYGFFGVNIPILVDMGNLG